MLTVYLKNQLAIMEALALLMKHEGYDMNVDPVLNRLESRIDKTKNFLNKS